MPIPLSVRRTVAFVDGSFIGPIKDCPWILLITALLTALALSLPLAARAAATTAVEGASPLVSQTYHPGDFKLAASGVAADLCVSPKDYKVVQIAADCLADDVQRVSGWKPVVKTSPAGLSGNVVLIGTLGTSPLIDSLVTGGKLNVKALRGKWESFLITVVAHPLPGVQSALVIAGSDRRGTAYGVFELSQQIGVSPWYWWADVTPVHKDTMIVAAGTSRQGPPSVKYRGIFFNDEDWGLRPWASQTFDPQTGNIGPKTYARVFELLLRLKANYLWPAMHPGTTPFNDYPQNKVLADDYGIVMGSSHAEPMLRNNVGEWKDPPETYNYATNPSGVRNYWAQRVKENGHYENVYTVGMRGIHDSSMQGPKDIPSRVKLLQQVIDDQRQLLRQNVNSDITKVPQVFCNYKEVLALYEAGLKVPDDVTLMWADDNFGYITRLSNPDEQKRSGGAGVYYHVSYWGAPEDYLWLCTTPPGLIWEEMSKAYNAGARTVWVLNVGDLKPAEMDTEFFLSLAWDIHRWNNANLHDFLVQWAQRQFGASEASSVANVLTEYYHLGYARKPEHMDRLTEDTGFSAVNYGDEAQRRLDDYARITAQADALYARIPAPLKDAFYELVVYPVRCAGLQNQKYIYAQKSALYAAQGRAGAGAYAQKALAAYDQIQTETAYYNTQLAGGKWRGMMSAAPRQQPAFLPPAAVTTTPETTPGLGIAPEGASSARGDAGRSDELLPFSAYTKDRRFVDLFNTGAGSLAWTATPSAEWIILSQREGTFAADTRVWVTIDWAKAPLGENVPGDVAFRSAGTEKHVKIALFHPKAPADAPMTGFVESNGCISMEAAHFTRRSDQGGAGWRVISELGRTGDSVAVFPTTTASVTDSSQIRAQSPEMEYQMYVFHPGPVKTTLYAVPTWPMDSTRGTRVAIAYDNDTPQIVDLNAGKAAWSANVLRAASLTTSAQTLTGTGMHVLHVWMVDPGVVLSKIVVDTGGVKPSYLGPPETTMP